MLNLEEYDQDGMAELDWRPRKMSDKFKLVGHEAVPMEDLLEWGRWLQTADRKVAFDQLTPEVRVSTVFLGLDHSYGSGPPLLFETMIFGGEHDLFQERYATWEQAEAGHKRAVELAATAARTGDTK